MTVIQVKKTATVLQRQTFVQNMVLAHLKSLFYLFVRLYTDLCTVTEHIIF